MRFSTSEASSGLSDLRDTFATLAVQLREAADKLERLGAPPEEELLSALTKARTSFLELVTNLRPKPDSSLANLTDVEAWQHNLWLDHVLLRSVALLKQIMLLAHKDKQCYQPLTEFQERALALIQDLEARTVADSEVESRLQPFALFLEIINEDDEERQLETYDLLCNQAGVIDRALAFAAMKGKLVSRTDRVADMPLEPDIEATLSVESDPHLPHADEPEPPVPGSKPSALSARANLANSVRLSAVGPVRYSRRRRPLPLGRLLGSLKETRLDPAHALLTPQMPQVRSSAQATQPAQPEGRSLTEAPADTLVSSKDPGDASELSLPETTEGARQVSVSEPMPPAATEPYPAPPSRGLPANLQSLQDFRSAYALDGSGQVIPAPWTKPDFPNLLLRAAERALTNGRFSELWLMARAAEICELTGLPTSEEVGALIDLVNAPASTATGAQSDRAGYLLMATSSGEAGGALKLAVTLESLRPSSDSRIPASEATRVVTAGGFGPGPVAEFLVAALRFGSEGGAPLDTLRATALKQASKVEASAPIDLEGVKDHLRSEIKRLWNAAGGRLLTNHCKGAWMEFMEYAQPTFERVLVGDDQPDRLLQALESLARDAEDLFDRRGARRDDRSKMDRTVKSLLDDAREVVFTQRRQTAQQAARSTEKSRADLLDAFEALEKSRMAITPTERWVCNLLELLLSSGRSDQTAAGISAALLRACPPLLITLPVVTLSSGTSDSALAEVQQFAYPVEAAALLLALPDSFPQSNDLGGLLLYLAEKIPALLIHFDGLSGAEAQRAAEVFDEAQIELHKELERLVAIWNSLLHLGSPVANELKRILDQARKAVEHTPPCESPAPLVKAWLGQVVEYAAAIRDDVAQALIREARRSSAEREAQVAEAVMRGRYAEALAVLKGEATPPTDSLRSLSWRDEAARRWSQPRKVLRDYAGDAEELVGLWLKGLGADRHNDDLRKAFAQFFLAHNRAKADIKARTSDIFIPCRVLRDWIAKDRLNPSFVPQLTQFDQLVIATPRLGPDADQFVQDTASMVAKEPGRLMLLLVPELSDGVRRVFLSEVRRRGLVGAALVDDLDLCRLLSPGDQVPNPLLGLLEILLEQAQKWAPLSPFESMDGQHTKPEMYVGRRDEAKELAISATFTRIFSGRRLGKSALLKSVVDTYDGVELPSRYKLRVLYVPAVGVDHAEGIVDAIAAVMRDRLEYRKAVGGDPGKRLEALIHGYLAENRKESLLIFLDEADQFVEAEIAAYEHRLENSLTWLMRSKLEAMKDPHDLPRVRFVFSGYRATHRSEGAWANWGDVLRLSPLEPEEAIKLIASPLERMGIRVGPMAGGIARRCGYQPAVLLRFGRQLLEHLDKLPPARREGVSVDDDDVALVFASDPVQQEIRTVVSNNFHGNRLGKIVFAALLLAFNELGPGGTLEDAPAHILRILAEVAPDFRGFAPSVGSPYDQIAHLLRDFVRRSLLDAVDPMRHFYRLRFPHHLQVLLQEDQTHVIRSEIRALGDGPIREVPVVHSMLETTAMEDLRLSLSSEGRELGVVAALACSHWPEPITDPRGLMYRLGFNDTDVVTVDEAFNARALAERVRLVIAGAGTDQVQGVLRRRNHEHASPLFLGGADLLRWGLRQGRREEGMVVVTSVGRLSLSHLHWWFERVRGLEFSGSSPIRRFLKLTDGIPFLVGGLDQALKRRVADSGTVTERELEAAIAEYTRDLPARAHLLRSAEVPAQRLLLREIELLHMVSLASLKLGGEDLSEVLSGWEEFVDLLDAPKYAPLVPGHEKDEDALSVLIRLGLLRRDAASSSNLASEQLDVIPPDDAVHDLVSHLQL